jgi:mRNA interferase MazF
MIKRGEVWVAVGKGYASKPRPVIALQNSDEVCADTILAVLVSSILVSKEIFPRIFIKPTPENGLVIDSYAMVDKITPIAILGFSQKLGCIDDVTMAEIGRRIIVELGL